MKLWLVRIEGDTFDLEQLTKLFHTPKYTIYREQNEQNCYYLKSSDFDQCTSVELVLNSAIDIVERINGAVHLQHNDIGPVNVAHIIELHEDGRRSIFVRAITASMKVRASLVELIITDTNGNIVAPIKPTPIETVMVASEQSKAVKDALRFFQIGDWVSLYKVFEIIRREAGQKAIEGWITKPTCTRFTRSANHPKVTGDQARHAVLKEAPPRNPMSLSEAKQVIAKILRSWLKIT